MGVRTVAEVVQRGMPGFGARKVLGERLDLDHSGDRREPGRRRDPLLGDPVGRHERVRVGVRGPHRVRIERSPMPQGPRRAGRASRARAADIDLEDLAGAAQRPTRESGGRVGARVGDDDDVQPIAAELGGRSCATDRRHAAVDRLGLVADRQHDHVTLRDHRRSHQSSRNPGSRRCPRWSRSRPATS